MSKLLVCNAQDIENIETGRNQTRMLRASLLCRFEAFPNVP